MKDFISVEPLDGKITVISTKHIIKMEVIAVDEVKNGTEISLENCDSLYVRDTVESILERL